MKKVSVLALVAAVAMLAVSCKNQPKEDEVVVEEPAVEVTTTEPADPAAPAEGETPAEGEAPEAEATPAE